MNIHATKSNFNVINKLLHRFLKLILIEAKNYKKSPFFIVKNPAKPKQNFKLFKSQFIYGHREILLNFLDLDYTHGLIGELQHGLLPDVNIWSSRTPFYKGKVLPYWTFSKTLEIESKNRNYKHVKAIGAPWFYMLKSLPPQSEELKKDFLIMPFHHTLTYEDGSNVYQKIARAKAFKEIVGSKTATICLGYQDFCNTELKEAFTEVGFNVVTLGNGIHNMANLESKERINFLPRLFKLLHQHNYYISDTASTSLFYALSLNLHVGIFPDLINYLNIRSKVAENTIIKSQIKHENDLIKLVNKDIFNNTTQPQNRQELLNLFLGLDAVLCKEELKNILIYKQGVYKFDINLL